MENKGQTVSYSLGVPGVVVGCLLALKFAGLTLMYSAIHGGEDKNFNQDQRDLLDPKEEEQFRQEFNAMFNNGKDTPWQ